jgi:hypothetical protein
MHRRPVVVLSVVAVVEPGEIVERRIGRDAPGDRLVGITAVVLVVAVELGEAFAEVVEGRQEQHGPPVHDRQPDHEGGDGGDLDPPEGRVERPLGLQRTVDIARVAAEESFEDVAPDAFRLAVPAVTIDR